MNFEREYQWSDEGHKPLYPRCHYIITRAHNIPPYSVQHFIDLQRLIHANQNGRTLKYINHMENLEWGYAFLMMERNTSTSFPEKWT